MDHLRILASAFGVKTPELCKMLVYVAQGELNLWQSIVSNEGFRLKVLLTSNQTSNNV